MFFGFTNLDVTKHFIQGEGNGNPLQYSCLENPMHRGAWQATVHGVAKILAQLSDQHYPMVAKWPGLS